MVDQGNVVPAFFPGETILKVDTTQKIVSALANIPTHVHLYISARNCMFECSKKLCDRTYGAMKKNSKKPHKTSNFTSMTIALFII